LQRMLGAEDEPRMVHAAMARGGRTGGADR